MIGFGLNAFSTLPKNVERRHFNVWQRPAKSDIKSWRDARHQSIRERLDRWMDFGQSEGHHYFDRGQLKDITILSRHYVSKGSLHPGIMKGSMFWTERYKAITHELYLSSIPKDYHLIAIPRHENGFISTIKVMRWWERMYETCDFARENITEWWWPFMTKEQAGIVCSNEIDAILIAAEMVDA